MDIVFQCKTNKQYVAINTLKVTLPNGTVLVIDRDKTEYDIQGINLKMRWKSCYLWSLDGHCIFGEEGYHVKEESVVEELKKLLESATYEFVLDEDVDEDYLVIIWKLKIA